MSKKRRSESRRKKKGGPAARRGGRPAEPEDVPSADFEGEGLAPGPDAEESAGLECRDCGCRHFEVVSTRRLAGRILRRRACRHCGQRITTVERELGTPDV